MTMLAIGIAVYILGSIFDVYTTKRVVIDNPVLFHETYRITAWILREWGWPGVLVAKLIVLGLVLGSCAMIGHLALASIVLIPAGAWYGYLAWHNKRLITTKRFFTP